MITKDYILNKGINFNTNMDILENIDLNEVKLDILHPRQYYVDHFKKTNDNRFLDTSGKFDDEVFDEFYNESLGSKNMLDSIVNSESSNIPTSTTENNQTPKFQKGGGVDYYDSMDYSLAKKYNQNAKITDEEFQLDQKQLFESINFRKDTPLQYRYDIFGGGSNQKNKFEAAFESNKIKDKDTGEIREMSIFEQFDPTKSLKNNRSSEIKEDELTKDGDLYFEEHNYGDYVDSKDKVKAFDKWTATKESGATDYIKSGLGANTVSGLAGNPTAGFSGAVLTTMGMADIAGSGLDMIGHGLKRASNLARKVVGDKAIDSFRDNGVLAANFIFNPRTYYGASSIIRSLNPTTSDELMENPTSALGVTDFASQIYGGLGAQKAILKGTMKTAEGAIKLGNFGKTVIEKSSAGIKKLGGSKAALNMADDLLAPAMSRNQTYNVVSNLMKQGKGYDEIATTLTGMGVQNANRIQKAYNQVGAGLSFGKNTAYLASTTPSAEAITRAMQENGVDKDLSFLTGVGAMALLRIPAGINALVEKGYVASQIAKKIPEVIYDGAKQLGYKGVGKIENKFLNSYLGSALNKLPENSVIKKAVNEGIEESLEHNVEFGVKSAVNYANELGYFGKQVKENKIFDTSSQAYITEQFLSVVGGALGGGMEGFSSRNSLNGMPKDYKETMHSIVASGNGKKYIAQLEEMHRKGNLVIEDQKDIDNKAQGKPTKADDVLKGLKSQVTYLQSIYESPELEAKINKQALVSKDALLKLDKQDIIEDLKTNYLKRDELENKLQTITGGTDPSRLAEATEVQKELKSVNENITNIIEGKNNEKYFRKAIARQLGLSKETEEYDKFINDKEPILKQKVSETIKENDNTENIQRLVQQEINKISSATDQMQEKTTAKNVDRYIDILSDKLGIAKEAFSKLTTERKVQEIERIRQLKISRQDQLGRILDNFDDHLKEVDSYSKDATVPLSEYKFKSKDARVLSDILIGDAMNNYDYDSNDKEIPLDYLQKLEQYLQNGGDPRRIPADELNSIIELLQRKSNNSRVINQVNKLSNTYDGDKNIDFSGYDGSEYYKTVQSIDGLLKNNKHYQSIEEKNLDAQIYVVQNELSDIVNILTELGVGIPEIVVRIKALSDPNEDGSKKDVAILLQEVASIEQELQDSIPNEERTQLLADDTYFNYLKTADIKGVYTKIGIVLKNSNIQTPTFSQLHAIKLGYTFLSNKSAYNGSGIENMLDITPFSSGKSSVIIPFISEMFDNEINLITNETHANSVDSSKPIIIDNVESLDNIPSGHKLIFGSAVDFNKFGINDINTSFTTNNNVELEVSSSNNDIEMLKLIINGQATPPVLFHNFDFGLSGVISYNSLDAFKGQISKFENLIGNPDFYYISDRGDDLVLEDGRTIKGLTTKMVGTVTIRNAIVHNVYDRLPKIHALNNIKDGVVYINSDVTKVYSIVGRTSYSEIQEIPLAYRTSMTNAIDAMFNREDLETELVELSSEVDELMKEYLLIEDPTLDQMEYYYELIKNKYNRISDIKNALKDNELTTSEYESFLENLKNNIDSSSVYVDSDTFDISNNTGGDNKSTTMLKVSINDDIFAQTKLSVQDLKESELRVVSFEDLETKDEFAHLKGLKLENNLNSSLADADSNGRLTVLNAYDNQFLVLYTKGVPVSVVSNNTNSNTKYGNFITALQSGAKIDLIVKTGGVGKSSTEVNLLPTLESIKAKGYSVSNNVYVVRTAEGTLDSYILYSNQHTPEEIDLIANKGSNSLVKSGIGTIYISNLNANGIKGYMDAMIVELSNETDTKKANKFVHVLIPSETQDKTIKKELNAMNADFISRVFSVTDANGETNLDLNDPDVQEYLKNFSVNDVKEKKVIKGVTIKPLMTIKDGLIGFNKLSLLDLYQNTDFNSLIGIESLLKIRSNGNNTVGLYYGMKAENVISAETKTRIVGVSAPKIEFTINNNPAPFESVDYMSILEEVLLNMDCN